eukprot:gb/GEZJ01002893.1/.p1 GENE.gb/GEZJ01002893.1/~~gb/GEZJ01002893.1/.p1  ORF type:complete len:201 (-),score=24.64 gb/GEZJ01002893.1/:78-680(-)
MVLSGGMLPLLRLVRVEDEAAEVPDSDDQDISESSGELPDGTIIQESPSFASLFAQPLTRLDETWLRPTLVASSTRSVIATNRTQQTLAVSAVDRLTPHELGSLLDSSAAIDSPPPGEALTAHGRERGDIQMAVVNVNKGQLTLDLDSKDRRDTPKRTYVQDAKSAFEKLNDPPPRLSETAFLPPRFDEDDLSPPSPLPH